MVYDEERRAVGPHAALVAVVDGAVVCARTQRAGADVQGRGMGSVRLIDEDFAGVVVIGVVRHPEVGAVAGQALGAIVGGGKGDVLP